jgi:hypothetical protein
MHRVLMLEGVANTADKNTLTSHYLRILSYIFLLLLM